MRADRGRAVKLSSRENAAPLGLIGLGLLGSALAERFLRAGHDLVGFDVRPPARESLVALGGRAAASSSAVFAECERVVLCLPDSAVVAAVVAGALEVLRPGQLLIDTTTGAPEDAEALARRLADRQVWFLDATILGSSEQARAGEVIVMAGGPAEVVEQAGDLFACFAARQVHAGPAGAGARLKLVVNLVLGLNRAALAEGLALARECGLNLAATLDVLRAGAAYSRIMDAKGPKMIARDFTPQARLGQHLKDVGLILAEAARRGARLPLTRAHQELLQVAQARGAAEEDNSAIFRAYDRQGPPTAS